MRPVLLTILSVSLALALLPAAALAQSQPPADRDAADQQALATTTAVDINQAVQQFNATLPQDRQAMTAQARQQFGSLTPAQQQALEQEAAKHWAAMTPEQQGALRQQFPGLLSGPMAAGAPAGN